MDRQVEPDTGAIQVAVLFPNPGNVLRPGQYARIRARTELRKGVALIPQRAVTELQGSFQVDVVTNPAAPIWSPSAPSMSARR